MALLTLLPVVGTDVSPTLGRAIKLTRAIRPCPLQDGLRLQARRAELQFRQTHHTIGLGLARGLPEGDDGQAGKAIARRGVTPTDTARPDLTQSRSRARFPLRATSTAKAQVRV